MVNCGILPVRFLSLPMLCIGLLRPKPAYTTVSFSTYAVDVFLFMACHFIRRYSVIHILL